MKFCLSPGSGGSFVRQEAMTGLTESDAEPRPPPPGTILRRSGSRSKALIRALVGVDGDRGGIPGEGLLPTNPPAPRPDDRDSLLPAAMPVVPCRWNAAESAWSSFGLSRRTCITLTECSGPSRAT